MPEAGEEIVPWEDTHVVRTKDLCKYMDEWVKKHQGRFPKNLVQSFQKERNFRSYGAIQYLADHMSEGSRQRNYRQLERIRKCNTQYTALRIADDILTAMECAYLFSDGEIKVYEAKVVDRRIEKFRKPTLA